MRIRLGLMMAALATGAMTLATAALAAPASGAAPAGPTPHTADGHPNLTGMWRKVVPGQVLRGFGFESGGQNTTGGQETHNTVRDGNMNYVEIDSEFIVKSTLDAPQYKPEYWDQLHTNEEFNYRRPADPAYGCKNPGVVRLFAPAEIFQSPNKVTLIYTGPVDDGTSGHIWVREVPTDGRPLPKPDDYEGLRPTGTSSGHWEGDTLVIETVDFPSDGVWYNRPGWFGTADAKVIERFQRTGDMLKYDMTIDDPAFVHPWVRPTQMLQVEARGAVLPQPLTCIERDGIYLPPTAK